VKGSEREKQIAEKVYGRLKEKYDISQGFKIEVEKSIPAHVGLGSTTQFTLGTGYGMLRSAGKDMSIIEMAKLLDRGRYSAIGTHGFEKGGFILEGGKTDKDEISPLLTRSRIPEDWRFIILCPKQNKGYDEQEERPIMEELSVDKKYPEKICHNLLMGILPAVEKEDISAFGEHLTRIQKLVGRSFSDYQEGIYHPAIKNIVESLTEKTYGGGQSSWGPTAYGLVKKEEIGGLKDELLSGIDEEEYQIWIGEPNNQGVVVQE
ncbi:MAG: beta-ribofuranosylaminobenzene 5'-phosphate synthase family protein, partial [Thermoplasmata archaeon]